jgi:hypothetical protein
MIGRLGLLAPYHRMALIPARTLASGFRTYPLARITPSLTLDCRSPCGEKVGEFGEV